MRDLWGCLTLTQQVDNLRKRNQGHAGVWLGIKNWKYVDTPKIKGNLKLDLMISSEDEPNMIKSDYDYIFMFNSPKMCNLKHTCHNKYPLD